MFDAGEKKIARYQQYFTVRNILERIQQRDGDGRRLGGVVWHTQGSGKSLTMVMLAKAIARLNLHRLQDRARDRPRGPGRPDLQDVHATATWSRTRRGAASDLAEASRRPQEPRHHDDHRQVRERGAQGQPAERERQRLRAGR